MDMTPRTVLNEVVRTLQPLFSLDTALSLTSLFILLSTMAFLVLLDGNFPNRNKAEKQMFTFVAFWLFGLAFLSIGALATLLTLYHNWQPEFTLPVLLCGVGLVCLALSVTVFGWFAVAAMRHRPQEPSAEVQGST